MKKFTWLSMFCFVLLFCLCSFAQGEFEIPQENQPAKTTAKLDTVKIYVINKHAIVTVRKGYIENSEFVTVEEKELLFKDTNDNPETPENEKCTDYTDFIKAIGANMISLRDFIKSKL